MPKYIVEFREVTYTKIEMFAENLDSAIHKVEGYREEAGRIVEEPQTDQLTATIYHSKGDRELKLIK